MYAGAARRGLGELAPIDPMIEVDYEVVDDGFGGSPDTSMTPTVIDTTVHTLPAPPLYAPASISPSMFPQQLPPIVTTVAPAGLSVMTLVWFGVMLYGTYVVLEQFTKSRRGH